MNLQLPFAEFDPGDLDRLLTDVEHAVDGAFLEEVDAALERLLAADPADEAAAA